MYYNSNKKNSIYFNVNYGLGFVLSVFCGEINFIYYL